MLMARFQIEGAEPTSVVGADFDWLQVMHFSKIFTSGLVGRSSTVFMSAGSAEGARSYVATERIIASTNDGQSGEFTVQHGGLESDPQSWFGHIVPRAGSGDFAHWSGSARIAHDESGAYFEIILDE
jgi:hypothetical protein